MTADDIRWIRNFVDGEFVDPDPARAFDALDPATGNRYARVHEADALTVDRAVGAARGALDRGWADTSIADRVGILRRTADLIDLRFDEFVAAELADTGKPITQARTLDVARAPANFRAFADIIATAGQQSFITETDSGVKALNYTLRKPLGVVAVIVPWNLPLLLLTWKVAPALACGNAVIVKPSEDTPATATLLAEVLADAGLPRGAYNVVHGFGADSAGAFLTSHPGVDGITFTGSSGTGTAVMRTAAARTLPVSLELGGKNAAVVFGDVDVAEAVEGLGRSIFTNTGQVCLCTERVYVQRSIFDEVVAGLADAARRLVLGRPQDSRTTTGPLISAKHREKVLSYLSLAVDEGATIVTGGGIPDVGAELAGGWWIEPTLWTGLSSESRVMREEVFGPVAGLIPFDTEDEAVALANDTEYGLASVVWTNDLRRGHRVAARMNVGLSWVNPWYLRDLRSPFGGVGLSGVGREGGQASLNFYTETSNVCVRL